VKDVDLLVQKAFEQLAEQLDLDGIAKRLGLIDGRRDAQDLDLDVLVHGVAGVASGALDWAGQLSHAVRERSGRPTGGSVRWILPLAIGAAAMAAAKNRDTLTRSLEQLKAQGMGVADDLRSHHLTELVDGDGDKQRPTGRRSDPHAFRDNLRVRAERREQRRRFFSS
jgi:hypothetical protein